MAFVWTTLAAVLTMVAAAVEASAAVVAVVAAAVVALAIVVAAVEAVVVVAADSADAVVAAAASATAVAVEAAAASRARRSPSKVYASPSSGKKAYVEAVEPTTFVFDTEDNLFVELDARIKQERDEGHDF